MKNIPKFNNPENISNSYNYQKLLDIAGIMFIAIDTNGIVTFANKKACEILEYEEDEILDKNWFENFVPERIKEEILPISKKILSGEIKIAEYYENPILTKTGKERIIFWHNSPIIDENGNITGHLSSGEDVTERKKTEKALKASEEKFRNTFENSSDGINIFTLDKKILDVNNKLVKLSGYSKKELLFIEMSDLYPESVTEQSKERIKLIQQRKKVPVFETILITKKGKKIPVEISIGYLINCYGYETVFQGNVRDIAERKKNRQTLKKNEKKLHKLNATKDKFFSIIAHDLKSPFSLMLGFSKLLYENFDEYDVSKQKRIVAILYENIQNTSELLDNLLLWSRSQRGLLKFNPEKENLYLLITNIIGSLSQAAEK